MTSLKGNITNKTTGEVQQVELKPQYRLKKYPLKGASMTYPNMLQLMTNFSPREGSFINSMIKYRDEYNIVRTKWIDIAKDSDFSTSQSYISQLVRKMKEMNLIQKHNKRWMINPFYLLPKYSIEEDNQFESQRIWKYLFEDKDTSIDQNLVATIPRLFE